MNSIGYMNFYKVAKHLFNNGNLLNISIEDIELLQTDIGNTDIYNGNIVPLDCPLTEHLMLEAEYKGREVDLNKPKRGGSKKFYVYVKDPKTKKVRKIEFGAKDGGASLSVKLNDPKARAAFAARHNCEQANDKTKASYWSCRLPRYAKSLGLSGGGKWW